MAETPLNDKDAMLAMNEALVLSALRQHENAAALESLNAQLQAEIVERKRTEATLRESEAYSQSVFEANPDCIKIIDRDGYIKRMNANGQCLMEIDDFSEVAGAHWPSLWPLESRAGIEAAIAEAKAGRSGHFSGLNPTAKGTPKWWDVIVNAVPGVSPLRLIASSRDSSEKKRAEERRIMLTRELVHRGSNLMAVIQVIVSRSLTGSLTLSEAREVLIQRLHALARSQSVLLSEGFECAPLSEIVRLEFEAYPDQVKAAGPPVMMNSRIAQTFALLLHELATNAVKYGALSRPNGRIAILWSIEGGGAEARLKFHWRERGGPPVAPPTRKGFGHTLLENVVEQEFGMPPMLTYESDGFTYAFEAPLTSIIATVAME